jgi:hypothetical protein
VWWGRLLLWLTAGALLSLWPGSPLRRSEWLLLAGGLSLTWLPEALALLVVAWFIAVHWRRTVELKRPVLHNARQLALVLLTLVVALTLYGVVYTALVDAPEADVAGGGSSASELRFYADRVGGELPRPFVLSAPVWVYRALLLVWALWLLTALVRWGRAAGEAFRAGGVLKRSPKAPPPPAAEAGPIT